MSLKNSEAAKLQHKINPRYGSRGKRWKRKKPVWCEGKTLPDWMKQKISKNRKGKCVGKDNAMYGKKSNLSLHWGRKRSKETKKKMRVAAKHNWKNKEYREKMINAARQSNLIKPRGFALKTIYSNTKIEQKIENELIKRGFIKKKDYYRNVKIDKITNVDFYFPKIKLVIEADGCYYHCCEKCKRYDKYTENRKILDLQKTKRLLKSGYQVFRFWEHEINESVEKCINKINDLKK